jgi:transposase-like protein
MSKSLSKVYSDAFIEQALVKVYSRGKRTIQDVADDLHVNFYTIKNWIRRKNLFMLKASSDREMRPQDWSRSEQLVALHETHGLDVEALQAWCRERGLFVHHLETWRTAFCVDAKPVAVAEAREVRTLQQENDKLKRDLDRKDKALAEAAALLLLQKKFNALWEDEVK